MELWLSPWSVGFLFTPSASRRDVLKLCNGQIVIACIQGAAEKWVRDHNKALPGMSGSLGKPRGCKIDSKTRSIFVICQQMSETIAESWQPDTGEPQGKDWVQINKMVENPICRWPTIRQVCQQEFFLSDPNDPFIMFKETGGCSLQCDPKQMSIDL